MSAVNTLNGATPRISQKTTDATAKTNNIRINGTNTTAKIMPKTINIYFESKASEYCLQ